MQTAFEKGFIKYAKLKKSVKLQKHQERVQRKLEKVQALLLWHGLGSGKTLSAIAAAGDEETDFVVPASLRTNLEKEIKNFVRTHKIKGKSYHKYLKDEHDPKKRVLVADEAHRLGTPTSGISKLMVARAKNYKKRILLTGSPLRNHPYELAPLHRILDPDSKMPLDKREFASQYIKEEKVDPGFINRVLFGVKPGTKERIKNEKKLEKLFRGKVDHHMAGDEDYPDVTEKHIEVEMSEEQQRLYDKTKKELPRSARIKMELNLPLSKSEKVHINNFFNSMRQVSNTTRTYGVKKYTPKMLRARTDLLKHINKKKGKALVYSNFLESGIGEYERLLDEKDIKYKRFDGSLNDKKRKEAVDAYNKGEVPVLLVSGAGSEGLDLKGTRLVQILEPHWNDARTDQVKGRAVRYKSHAHLPKKDRKVIIKNYYSKLRPTFFGLKKPKTGVDEYLNQLRKDKTRLNTQFLEVLKRASNE